MTRAELLALAERVEKAKGPDRELDYAVAAAAGWPDSPIMKQNARRYTESLDAALTLVPEGWDWTICKGTDEAANAAMSPAGRIATIEVSAATPALALTAAALRARAEGGSDE